MWSEANLNCRSQVLAHGHRGKAVCDFLRSKADVERSQSAAPLTVPNGNLTSDGRWTNRWDAENRLIEMETLTTVPDGAKKKLLFTYDHQGRRISKTVSNWVSGAWTLASTNRFVYDGWNLVGVFDASTLVQSFVWGTDLSGTMQGAGGVGGLLAFNDTTNVHFVAYDGNGNVTRLIKVSDGKASAIYEYGAFGEPMRMTGTAAKLNPFRFSTKYTDDESDLLYYGYRYYNQNTGRWLSKDPIEERGGRNLFGFCHNNPISRIDYIGQNDLAFVFLDMSEHRDPDPMPCAAARSLWENIKLDRGNFRHVYDDTGWYNRNRAGNVDAAKNHFRKGIESQSKVFCEGGCFSRPSEWTMKGGSESQYGDKNQTTGFLGQDSINIGDLDFEFSRFKSIKRSGGRVDWCAEILAIEKHGAQKDEIYFKKDWVHKYVSYPIYWSAFGPERKVIVGSWEICGTILCCSSH